MPPDMTALTATATVTAQTITLTSILYMIVKVLKSDSGLALQGDIRRVRKWAFFVALFLAYGNIFFTGATFHKMPDLSPSLLWGTFLQAIIMTGSAFGYNAYVTQQGDKSATASGAQSGDPLAPVKDAVGAAQDANQKAADALDAAQSGVAAASDALDEQAAPAFNPTAPAVAPVPTVQNVTEFSAEPFAEGEMGAVAAALSKHYGWNIATIQSVLKSQPAIARQMLSLIPPPDLSGAAAAPASGPQDAPPDPAGSPAPIPK